MARQQIVFCFSWTIPLLLSGTLAAAPMDVILALDSSRSMRDSDPQRYSIAGAQLFSGLLGSDDRLAVTTFGDVAETLLTLTSLGRPATHEQANARIAAIQMDGGGTDFGAALEATLAVFDSQPDDSGAERLVVLFTDGHLNVGAEEATQAAGRHIFDVLVPRLKAAGIHVYGVAFSPNADVVFLERLSEATGGVTFTAAHPQDIYAAFVRVFEQTERPLVADIENGTVHVDTDVDSLRLLVRREANAGSVSLTDPSNQQITAQDQGEDVSWQSTPGYDHITIRNPQRGAWQVSSPSSDQKAYIESDLDLEVDLPVRAQVATQIPIVARISRQGFPLAAGQIKHLQMRATISRESGPIIAMIALAGELDAGRAGSFVGSLQFDRPGAYGVKVSAEHPDFRRSRLAFISVRDAGAELPTDPADNQAQSAAVRAVLIANLALLVAGGAGIAAWRWRARRSKAEPADNRDS